MEKELSNTVDISVVLIALSVFLAIVLSTVAIGMSIREKAATSLTDMKDDLTVSYVSSLANGITDSEMPTATAYNILRTYNTVIVESVNSMTGKTVNLMMEDSDLQNDLSGRVQLEVIKTPSGAYIAIIHDKDCNYRGGSSCGNATAVNALKTKYNVGR